MPAPSETFVHRLREIRRTAKISQAELADRVSSSLSYRIDSTAITRMERGDRVVRLDEAVAIADVLGVSLDEMLHEGGEVAAQLHQLQHELQQVEWQAADAKAEAAQARASADAIRQQIAALEAEQRSGDSAQP